MAIARALLSVSDKHGLAEFARALWPGTASSCSRPAAPRRRCATRASGCARSPTTPASPKSWTGASRRSIRASTAGCSAGAAPTRRSCASTASSPSTCSSSTSIPSRPPLREPDCSYAEAIENIDVGGPAMLRAAAKNHAGRDRGGRSGRLRHWCSVKLETSGETSIDTRSTPGREGLRAHRRVRHRRLRLPAARAAAADRALPGSPRRWCSRRCRSCAMARIRTSARPCTARLAARCGSIGAAQHACRARSCRSTIIQDADTAIECVRQFAETACTIVKHANPCGVALGTTRLARPTSSPTGPIRPRPTAASSPSTVRSMRPRHERSSSRQFAEVIAAPAIDAEALTVLAAKPDIRVLVLGAFAAGER